MVITVDVVDAIIAGKKNRWGKRKGPGDWERGEWLRIYGPWKMWGGKTDWMGLAAAEGHKTVWSDPIPHICARGETLS